MSDIDNATLLTGMSGADAFDPVEIDSLDWHGFEHWVVDRARESGDGRPRRRRDRVMAVRMFAATP